jgi:proteasome lid subunit RPN8/RPN11
MLTIASIDMISKQAVAEYPAECCGIVTGSASTQRVHPCRNRQDELHAKDPGNHPRTSREAYDIDRHEMERIFADAAARGEQVVYFYHSHIDCGAYFSQMDQEVLMVFGDPEFPGAVHVVVSLKERKIMEINGYLWDREKQGFVQVAVSRNEEFNNS